jgi:translation initiation factor 1
VAKAREKETRLAYSTGGEREPEEPEAASEPSPGIRLRLDRRGAGRVVTVVTGLPGAPEEVAACARDLRTACAAGGTLRKGVLELQGDHRRRLEAWLRERGLRFKRVGGSPE